MRMRKLSEANIVLAFHTVQWSHDEINFGPPTALSEYLRDKCRSLTVIMHPFSYCSYRRSTFEFYQGGLLRRKRHSFPSPNSEPISYLKDFIVSLVVTLVNLRNVDVYIGVDSLNCLLGIFLRKIGLVRTVVFYSIDLTPRRFRNLLMQSAYVFLDTICVKHSDLIWNLSSRMALYRRKQGASKRKAVVVPVGITSVASKPVGALRRKALVYAGTLTYSKGLELVLRALPQIKSVFPDIKLIIIGKGQADHDIRSVVARLHLTNDVDIRGHYNHAEFLHVLANLYGAVGLATYTPDPDNIAWFADPTKVKEYLACGIPVIITRVPEVAQEIEKRRVGLAIPFSDEALVQAALTLIGDEALYDEFRKNALDMAGEFIYDRIFDAAIRATGLSDA